MSTNKPGLMSFKQILLGLVIPLFLLVLWFGFSLTNNPFFKNFPSPKAVTACAYQLSRDGLLFINTIQSLIRVTSGFLLGTVSGFIFGIIAGSSLRIKEYCLPLFHALRQVPVVGWIPIIILWFGSGELSKVLFIALSVFFPMALHTYDGIEKVSVQLIELGKAFALRRSELVWRIIFPAALPEIMTGVKASLGIAWMMVVAAEILTIGSGGLGDMLLQAREQFRLDIVIVGILIIGIVGFLFNLIIDLSNSLILHWKR